MHSLLLLRSYSETFICKTPAGIAALHRVILGLRKRNWHSSDRQESRGTQRLSQAHHSLRKLTIRNKRRPRRSESRARFIFCWESNQSDSHPLQRTKNRVHRD